MQATYDQIKQLLALSKIEEAQQLVEEGLQENETDAMLHYLRGTISMKQGNWQLAMNSFLHSEQFDAQGPASEARKMLTDILDFYHKDYYNP